MNLERTKCSWDQNETYFYLIFTFEDEQQRELAVSFLKESNEHQTVFNLYRGGKTKENNWFSNKTMLILFFPREREKEVQRFLEEKYKLDWSF